MRQVIFGGASSLDNFLARTNHAVDWLLWNDEIAAYIGAFWPRVDAVLMGRKTYEVAAAAGQGVGYPGKDICLVGGGDFARTLFEADLIDEVGFNECRGRSISS